ncbi:Flagella basal body P-ring formation protein FlgA [Enterobacter cloacae]|uniref:Flagella basal body P-ring formation protein FlgA n=1 Tax=Enterobacter sichuanensis TaxID=2071710 RepID=A0AAE4IY00_9ENTR|nr:flagellar basal body P-ring formation chaperone FlgA [Enterobacter sichuanensis]MDR9946116.1 flagellar basal body P-ring formation chaperone FlgA [Enterobacter sichuanensis]CAF2461285.1 Flagella basal body P-ring formation protein FlgA [Enterobacter cloacae]CAH5339709.1 Flagella basal body P-ring formation protein FlgA [Enterobacter cloacae]HDR2784010.1 flagellar basal body P-ring formation protein FlgA [Enterobacter sichuanensis]
MKLRLFSAAMAVLLCSVSAGASVPSDQTAKQRLLLKLDALIQQPESNGEVVRTVALLATPAQLAGVCENPELSLVGRDSRLTGKRTVLAQCGARRHFLPVRISAQGTWWVASQSLPGGAIVQRSDIEPVTGSLDNQPGGLIFSADEIIGQRLTRAIDAGKPLLENQLRQQWRLRAGQTVDLVTAGSGFRIRSQGKALNNAAVDDVLKVKTTGGRTVSGKVAADGQVMIISQ